MLEHLWLTPADAQLLKRVRTLSVADAPDAFGATLDQVNAAPDQYWESLAGSFADPRHGLLILMEAGEPAGCVYARVAEAGTGHIGSMWVAPTHRRQGLGRRLLEIGVERLRALGVTTAQLWVTEGNLAATSLYLGAGFTFTGVRDVLREGSSLMRVQMEKHLRV